MTTPARHNSHRPPVALIACAVLVACVVLLAVVLIIWREWSSFAVALPWLAQALRFAAFLAPVVAVYVGIVTAWRRYGDRQFIKAYHVERLTMAQRSQGLPQSIASLNIHPTPPASLSAAPDAPQGATLSNEAEWLSWTDQAPHLMVAGRTDSGKTTTVEAVLARRILAGDLILVIDPHYQAGKWLGARAIGGGRDYAACYQTFDAIRALLDKRYQSFNNGTRTEDFKRVTIIVDEVPAIIAHAQANSKALYERWLLFATSLGSEARKVRISIVLLTQSPLVRDIGISSAMRENFTRIALGDTAADLLREEPSADKKQALLELLRGRPYPAAMEYRNNWYALRNDDVPRLASANGVAPRVPMLLLAPVLSLHSAPQGTLAPTARVAPLRAAPPTAQIAPPTVPEQIVDLLRSRVDGWMTPTEIAATLQVPLKTVRTEVKEMFDRGTLRRRRVTAGATNEWYEYAVQLPQVQPVQRELTPSA